MGGIGVPLGAIKPKASARQSAVDACASARASSCSNRGDRSRSAPSAFTRKYEYLKDMRFTQDVSTGINIIRGYANGELRVNEAAYRGAVIVSAATLIDLPNIQNLEE